MKKSSLRLFPGRSTLLLADSFVSLCGLSQPGWFCYCGFVEKRGDLEGAIRGRVIRALPRTCPAYGRATHHRPSLPRLLHFPVLCAGPDHAFAASLRHKAAVLSRFFLSSPGVVCRDAAVVTYSTGVTRRCRIVFHAIIVCPSFHHHTNADGHIYAALRCFFFLPTV